ncbi:hypothetical protein TTHERM_00134960 (macronuclear) [Tetrahymena thermophila SB210]|uniref:Uncharacterized protein n=1 Tax=Tetrahymena thermophila (strain SB210) TaxID=312017 RepID=I7M269_TETTS|nr:hypothetical protein TTHERM_00134960 [Tetrahymena thermophila SB210]EAR99431.3 hypothetical protein TTHERM_00134960 [Tetrahymena thermophila SB210]|eukprot:XP_001019676.3 hypothetical protein TTHERM_00134960 [Tetrahymena thermophila SB210]
MNLVSQNNLEIQQNIQLQFDPKLFSEIYLEKASFSIKNSNNDTANNKQKQQKSVIDSYFKSIPTNLFGISFIFLEQQDIQGKEMQDLGLKLDFYAYRQYFQHLQNISVDIMPGNFPSFGSLKLLIKTMNLLQKVNNKILWVRQDKIVELNECIELALMFYEQRNLKYSLFYFSKMLSIEVYNGQLYIDIRESVYINSESLTKIFQALQKSFPSFYDLHIRIGDNNSLNSNIIQPFSEFVMQYAQNLQRLKIFIGNRNYIGSKLFSKLGQAFLPKLTTFQMEVMSNNDQLSTDSQGLFDFLRNQQNLQFLSLNYGSKNSLNAKTFENFGKSLQNLKKLTDLDINIGQWNKIESLGCNNFTESIKNMNLKKIKLIFEGQNGITPDGASKFFDILSTFNGLNSIQVGFGDKNCLEEKCIRSFSDCLHRQIYLSTLSLNLIHKINTDTSILFQSIENKNALYNLQLKIGQDYNINDSMESLCQSLISLTQLKNLSIDFIGTKEIQLNKMELLCMAIRKIPSLIGLQFYTDDLADDKTLSIFRYIFEGNINFKDIRIGYNVIFQHNFSKFELEIKGKKRWDRDIIQSICRQISKYQPIKDFIIKFDAEKTRHCQPEDLVTFLRYACMSLQKNPNKNGKVFIFFEGFLEIYTQSILVESYNLYEYQNQFLLKNSETAQFFENENKLIHINYMPKSTQSLSILQLEDVISLVSGLGYNCINLKSSFGPKKQAANNQQQGLMQMLGLQQQQQQQQMGGEEEEDQVGEQNDDDEEEEGQNQQQQGLGGNNQNQNNFSRNQFSIILSSTISSIKSSKLKKLTVEAMNHFYMRVSESKFDFYLFERESLPQHSLQQLNINLIQKTTHLKEIQLDLRHLNNQGINSLRHLIDNQQGLVKLYLGGQIKLLKENIRDMSLFHFQLRSLQSLVSLNLDRIQYLGLNQEEIPALNEHQQQQFRLFMQQNHNDLIARLEQIQNPTSQQEEQELQGIQDQIIQLRNKKMQEYFTQSVEEFKQIIDNTKRQVIQRKALCVIMKFSKLKINRKLKGDIIIDIGRSLLI